MGAIGESDVGNAALETPEADVQVRGPLSFTRHARKRGARRNVAPDAVEYVLTHGRMIQRTGVLFFFLGRRDIPPSDRGASWAARLEGTIVIVSSDGVVITVYRDRHGLRPIARKMKYRLCDRTAREQPPAECAGVEVSAEALTCASA